jgi:dual specificity tyrosine-phosphorylation-regulated kinase 2/3/4
MSAPYLLTHKAKHLTSYEQAEVLAYKEIYFYGKKAEKVYASKMLDFNEGYDKEDGDYKIILHDHLGYRYEIISLLGEGSFGKVRC